VKAILETSFPDSRCVMADLKLHELLREVDAWEQKRSLA
jgi:hypothetical protein